jgi:formylglycine-generating enzyme required for sulfatase activity
MNKLIKFLLLIGFFITVSNCKKEEEKVVEEIEDFSFPGEIISVEGGSFQMGLNVGDSAEMPAHNVTVSDFKISKYEITNLQYADYMNHACIPSNGILNGVLYVDVNQSYCQISHNGSQWVAIANKGEHPMVSVTWNGAKAFCEYYKGQLPTEAQWEFAAKGGNSSNGFSYSGSSIADDVCWSNSNSGIVSHTVGIKDANEIGIHDMSGNVWEWTNDWFSRYDSTSKTNPQGPSTGVGHVWRGGSYFAYPIYCTVTIRSGIPPTFTYEYLGFRPAFD